MDARTIEEIQAGIIADVAAQPDLTYVDNANVTHQITENTSKRAQWRLWTWIVASAISLVEQFISLFQTQTEASIAAAVPETSSWLVNKVFQFQYDATNPQVVQLVNQIPVYPVVDPSLQITSRCSVATTTNKQVLIKVATGAVPAAFTVGQVSALQDYVNIIGVPGIAYKVSSAAPDQLYIQANIYYQGQYSAVIQQAVTDALNSFMAAQSSQVNFNGKIQMSDVENVIRNVAGVNDVTLVNVRARKDATTLADADYLIQAQTLLSRLWPTVAGYIIQETTAGNTFADTLTFIAQ